MKLAVWSGSGGSDLPETGIMPAALNAGSVVRSADTTRRSDATAGHVQRVAITCTPRLAPFSEAHPLRCIYGSM